MVYILYGTGLEEIEAITVADILRRAQIPMQTVGIGGKSITGAHGLVLETDITLEQLDLSQLDCIVLPGGLGTYDEFFDIVTLKQLGLYLKPIIILNTDGFYDRLLAHLAYAMDEHMLRTEHAEAWRVATTPAEALDLCEQTPLFDADIRKLAKV